LTGFFTDFLVETVGAGELGRVTLTVGGKVGAGAAVLYGTSSTYVLIFFLKI
jgi:hypothetical protein